MLPHARSPLTITRTATGFVVRDPLLAAAVGADALPLPFTADADPTEVLAHLQRLNPKRSVLLDDDVYLLVP